MDENPSLIQGGRVDEGLSDIPIFLIHDGGGTTFSYFCLGPLNRHVYGIHNPRFSSGHGWEGGMKELAAEYAELVQSVVPRGKVLLGGWSFGGLASLEVARILAESSDTEVLGIVMIDSMMPSATFKAADKTSGLDPTFFSRSRPEIRKSIQESMKAMTKIVEDWDLPTWPNPDNGASLPQKAVKNRQDTLSNGGMIGTPTDKAHVPEVKGPPPTILIRCQRYIPMHESRGADLSPIDLARDQEQLGWEEYPYYLVRVVMDLPSAHHFNLFSGPNLMETTSKIAQACEMLEKGVLD